jgi:hypothetical protein
MTNRVCVPSLITLLVAVCFTSIAFAQVNWWKTYGGAHADGSCSVQQTTDGGYIIVGHTCSFGAGSDDVCLIKTNASGDTLWTRTYGGTSDDWGYSVQPTTDGGYIVAGYACSFGAGGADVYFIKTDSLGNVAVAESKATLPRTAVPSLSCEPNPFSGSTGISLTNQFADSKPVSLHVYDAQGRLVRTLAVSRKSHTVWDGRDDIGQFLPSGPYFVRCDAAGVHATARPVLQR